MGNVPLFQQFASIEECLSNIIVLVKLSNFRQIHDSRLDPNLLTPIFSCPGYSFTDLKHVLPKRALTRITLI
jgi:hypothetical protein